MRRLKARAFAKLNLWLDITGRRADGYHLLETVMQSISLHDVVTLEMQKGSGISICCDRQDVPTDSRNTAYRAAELFMQAAGVSAQVDITIEKHIPSGAGMGGGSADAAAVLALLNSGADFPLNEKQLLKIAAQVGADVPFCLVGGTKLCRGIGEEISVIPEIESSMKLRRDKYYLVVKPEFSCPTGEAYAKYDASPVAPHGGLESFISAMVNRSFSREMYNVFQKLYADERIEALCTQLVELGAEGAMLTGSGSAVFGVFEDHYVARTALERLPGCFKELCTPSHTGGVEIIGMEGYSL